MGYVSFSEGRSCFAFEDKLENPFFHHPILFPIFHPSKDSYILHSSHPERHKSVDPHQGFQLALDKKQTRKVQNVQVFQKQSTQKDRCVYVKLVSFPWFTILGANRFYLWAGSQLQAQLKTRRPPTIWSSNFFYLTAILMPQKSDIHWTFSRDVQLLESS